MKNDVRLHVCQDLVNSIEQKLYKIDFNVSYIVVVVVGESVLRAHYGCYWCWWRLSSGGSGYVATGQHHHVCPTLSVGGDSGIAGGTVRFRDQSSPPSLGETRRDTPGSGSSCSPCYDGDGGEDGGDGGDAPGCSNCYVVQAQVSKSPPSPPSLLLLGV